jgi:ABC-type phosphate transport system auxiliary subunit
MLQQNISVPKPEEDELARKKAELSELQSRLADQELALTVLRSELTAFERTYLRTVGCRYAELDEIQAQIAEQRARLRPDKSVRDEATHARERAFASRNSVEKAGAEPPRGSKSQTLRSLYREVAKRIHPDLATDPLDRARREQFMADANRAYEEGDEARLRAILTEYEASPESVKGEGTAAELVRVIRKIAQVKKRLTKIDQELAELRNSELFALKAKVDRSTVSGTDLLKEMAEDLDVEIAILRERLKKIYSERTSA